MGFLEELDLVGFLGAGFFSGVVLDFLDFGVAGVSSVCWRRSCWLSFCLAREVNNFSNQPSLGCWFLEVRISMMSPCWR